MRVTISGPPGSGKTTVAEMVSSKLSLELVTGGKIFRDEANRLKISLAELGSFAEKEEKYDKNLDEYLLDVLKKKDNILVESRLSGWLCYLNRINAFKVFVNASEEVRLQRIKKSRESRKEEIGHNPLSLMREREESEWARYRMYYGIDYRDVSIYDLVIDATEDGAQKIAEVIISGINLWEGAKRKIH